jgi:hypothetical protein
VRQRSMQENRGQKKGDLTDEKSGQHSEQNPGHLPTLAGLTTW